MLGASRMQRKIVFATVGLVIVTLAALIGIRFSSDDGESFSIFCEEDHLTLLNPSLRCRPAEPKQEYVSFKQQLESMIRDWQKKGGVQSVAVYFRDLEDGPWFGIGEDELFSPASTMKVPVLIAYYKMAEGNPGILERQIEIGNSGPSRDEDNQEGSLQVGGTYTVDELLRRMIVYSDNSPLHVLFAYLKQFSPTDDIFAETLAEMGMAKSEGSVDDYMTVKRYASVYRVLYNASYLSKEQSQRALDLLSRSASPQGIREGVPPDVPIAHKFGLRVPSDAAIQLHDCGIIYEPANHFVLCIMTKGKDVPTLSKVISDIARMVYEEVMRRASAGLAVER